jgi:hypothetical protein
MLMGYGHVMLGIPMEKKIRFFGGKGGVGNVYV